MDDLYNYLALVSSAVLLCCFIGEVVDMRLFGVSIALTLQPGPSSWCTSGVAQRGVTPC